MIESRKRETLMLFWSIVVAVLVVVLALAWLHDRKRSGQVRPRIATPENDAAVGEAKSESVRRRLGGFGPGGHS